MSRYMIEAQYFAERPPRDLENINLAVTAASQSTDLRTLNLPDALDATTKTDQHVVLELQAVGTDVTLSFSPAGVTVVIATTGQVSGVGYKLASGTKMRVRIARKVDKFLNYIGAATGNLHIRVASFPAVTGVGSQ